MKSGGAAQLGKRWLVIESLRNLGLIPDAVVRRCALGKDT